MIKCTDIFTPDNTEWVNDWDDEGHTWMSLEFTGDVEEECEEYGITEDEFYDLLADYEALSKFEMED